MQFAMRKILNPVRTSTDGWLLVAHIICCLTYGNRKKREAIIGKTVSLEAYGDVPDLMDNILAWIAHTEYQETVEEFIGGIIAARTQSIPCIL